MPPEDINKHTYKVIFPQEMLALQQEILLNHPQLTTELNALGNVTLQEKIAYIAAYCGLLLDGYFTDHDLLRLFELLIEKLKTKSAIILIR
jgi:hypothetical protein